MPSISTMVYPAPAYVRVEANWADVAQAVSAAVYRVDCVTGQRIPLRPYVSFDGDFLDLSCGYGIWWDTEPQLDRCVYYCTQAIDAAGNTVTMPADLEAFDTFTRTFTPTVSDTFTRVVANGWGNADTGQAWTNSGGAAADYNVAAGRGTASMGVVNSSRFETLSSISLADVDMYADISIPVVATGASISTGLRLRSSTTSDFYYIEIDWRTDSTARLQLVSRVAGVSTTIAGPVNKGTYAAADTWRVRGRVVGTSLLGKLWKVGTPEPFTWDAWAQTSTIVAAAPVGTRCLLSAGNTNPLPVVASFDNIQVYAVTYGWGTLTSGQTWTPSGGNAFEYTVYDGHGATDRDTSTGSRRVLVTGPTPQDSGQAATFTIPVIALTDSIDVGLMSRYAGSGDYYLAVGHFHNVGNFDVRIRKQVAGVFTTLVISPIVGTYAAGESFRIRFVTQGPNLMVRAWRAIDPEPTVWQAVTTDTSFTGTGQVGVRNNLQAANTNIPPVTIFVDNYELYDPCSDLVPIETCSDGLVVPSSGEFRLGDPVRPCNDVTLQFTGQADPACVPTQGIFFANMSDEDAEANSGTFAPVNSVYPIGIYRARRSLNATLTTLTRTFADRDAMRQLNAPGGPLLLRGPAQYGIDDRYMLVGNVTEHRQLSDHRIQPRAVVLPHVQLAYPYGPSQGVCGAQVDDLCDIYPTWDAIAAAGLTYADLLRGRASNDTPIPATSERDWDEVNSDFASWNALNAGEPDWNNTLAGD
jgi:hypothetical protein